MKIVNFGSCNIDYVYSLDHIVLSGETENATAFNIFPGGKGLNQSIASSKAGAEVFHAGIIGAGGEMLLDVLKDSGVDVSFVQKSEESCGHAIIQVDARGKNSIFVYSGSNSMFSKKYIDEVLENFSSNDTVLLQNEINNVDYIIEKAYEKNMRIIFNPSPFNVALSKVDFGKIGYLILNETEMEAFTGKSDMKTALECVKAKFPKMKVMLTLGSKGCVFYNGRETLYQPAFFVDAVDTTAAGDTFTGYFAAELIKETDCAQMLKNASAASALAVTAKGASSSIPERNAVINALGYLRERI